MKLTCAISGIEINLPAHFTNVKVSHKEGYFHPVFALPMNQLRGLYSKHCKGGLTPTESYLAFLATLHQSSKVIWETTCCADPNSPVTIKIIENNFSQLMRVITLTDAIRNPRFKQPSLRITLRNNDLSAIRGFIAAWADNIDDFNMCRAEDKEEETLKKAENALSYLLLSGTPLKECSLAIAEWADKAAGFPEHKAVEWKRIIRTCFNAEKIFKTPLADIKEVKEYCESNIEVGSIHYHSLITTLKGGIQRHVNYLGMGELNFSLLPSLDDLSPESAKIVRDNWKEVITSGENKIVRNHGSQISEGDKTVAKILASPDVAFPREEHFVNKADYIKAKLAYRLKQISKKDNNDLLSGL